YQPGRLFLLGRGRGGSRGRLGAFGVLFALQAGRSRDRGDGEVAVDRRLRTCRQLDRRDVDGIADVGAGQVDRDELGNRVGRNVELDLVAHDVENAAALEAGRGFLVHEVHGHVDGDHRILAD